MSGFTELTLYWGNKLLIKTKFLDCNEEYFVTDRFFFIVNVAHQGSMSCAET